MHWEGIESAKFVLLWHLEHVLNWFWTWTFINKDWYVQILHLEVIKGA